MPGCRDPSLTLLYLFHNANTLLEKGTGPYYYLPKLESHYRSRPVERRVCGSPGLVSPIGTIRATVLWKRLRLLSKWKKLYQLRDHLLGLNCGRWDYLFSFIKKVQDAS
jgi:malate synthase